MCPTRQLNPFIHPALYSLILFSTADIVLNVESEHVGGMRAILHHLLEFFKAHPGAQGRGWLSNLWL